MTIQHYLQSRYVRGGRVWPDLDCWGLVRLARADLFGRAPLPLYGASMPGDFRTITRAVTDVSGLLNMRPCQPRQGAIATAWMGGLCVHVGLCVEIDGCMRILETDAPTGPCHTDVRRFARRYARVEFYDDDPNLSGANAQPPD